MNNSGSRPSNDQIGEATADTRTRDQRPHGGQVEVRRGQTRRAQVEGELRLAERQLRRAEAEEDRLLVVRAQAGDQHAFRALVEKHQRRAHAVAFSLVRNEQDAREVVQEAFLRVYRSLTKFQGDSSFFTWFFRIVTNSAIDCLRRPSQRENPLELERDLSEARDLPFFSSVPESDPDRNVLSRQIQRRIEQELERLPPYHRGVIVMRELEGMSYEEIAAAMGISKGTVMSRLFHARQKLQRALRDLYDEQRGVRSDDKGDA